MKNLLIFAMLTIFIFACDDKDSKKTQEEEVIEEILYHYFLNSEGNHCDTLILNSEFAKVTFRKYCEVEPLFDTLFYYKDIGVSFVDTFGYKDIAWEERINYDSLCKVINFNKFYNYEDTVFIDYSSNSGGLFTKIQVRTNLRKKEIVIKGKYGANEHLFIDTLFMNFQLFRQYHYYRLSNLHGRRFE